MPLEKVVKVHQVSSVNEPVSHYRFADGTFDAVCLKAMRQHLGPFGHQYGWRIPLLKIDGTVANSRWHLLAIILISIPFHAVHHNKCTTFPTRPVICSAPSVAASIAIFTASSSTTRSGSSSSAKDSVHQAVIQVVKLHTEIALFGDPTKAGQTCILTATSRPAVEAVALHNNELL